MYLRAPVQGYEEALGVHLVPSYLPALNTMVAFGDLYSQTDRKKMANIMYNSSIIWIYSRPRNFLEMV
ncbi:hypothetical protein A1O1_05435 [Capronia coronata CBS 617.96]|uniref:Uncharacterized protein n=1 Tax=Capronia coronata CBS 617.96 TaxID=1182541 RepID=W9YFR2_9EURO|nr:uncharacterized protein A1O1_05435 [Capronia coronata CBS 617.96]EXJ88505.1 hypothetical protein A1O1_05435 [Capronia coronata CBS 617.96]